MLRIDWPLHLILFALAAAGLFALVIEAYVPIVSALNTDHLNMISAGLQALGGLLQAFLAGLIGIYVYVYTRRRDQLDFLTRYWAEQQSINIATLEDRKNLETMEKMVYGLDYVESEEFSRFKYHLFLYVNRILHFYLAYERSIFGYAEYRDLSGPSAGLLKEHAGFVLELVSHRGYSTEFRRELARLLEDAKTPTAPQAGTHERYHRIFEEMRVRNLRRE